MKKDILKIPEEEIKELEFETFELQNNYYTLKNKNFLILFLQ